MEAGDETWRILEQRRRVLDREGTRRPVREEAAEEETVISLAIVCEAKADRELGAGLADRILVDEHEWADGILDDLRAWRGRTEKDAFLDWHDVSKLSSEQGLRHVAHGRFDARGGPQARATRQALFLLMKGPDLPDGVALLVDSDGMDKRTGLEAAVRDETTAWPFRIAIGVADRERESWILSAWLPENALETRKLAAFRRELGFDPTNEPEKLSAGGRKGRAGEIAKRDPKRVVGSLCPTKARERACWESTPLTTLESKGARNGLAAFLKDVRDEFAPLFTDRPVKRKARRTT